METRSMHFGSLGSLLALCAALSACTLLVDNELDKKPAHGSAEGHPDAGDDAEADLDGGESDASAPADSGSAGSDAATLAHADAATPDAEGPGADGGATGSLKLSLGHNHACGITTAGKLRCWGANAENQLTLPTDRSYQDVACGDYHSCALDVRGALVCVGRNRDGQRVSENGPFAQVTAGDAHTCALDAAGKAHCWGSNTFGQSTPPTDAFVSLSAGTAFTCGIRAANESLVCWGSGAEALTAQVKDKKFASLEAGPSYVCGVTDAQEGLCWNASDYKPPALGQVLQIAAGDDSACALLTDHSVTCWFRGSTWPVGMDKGPLDFVAVGGTGRCAVPKTGHVFCEPEDGSAFAPGPTDFP